MIMARREKMGKQSTNSKEKQIAEMVMNLYDTDHVLALRIYDYHKRPESQKKMICDLFKEITLCKVPAQDGTNDLIFFLGKEASV